MFCVSCLNRRITVGKEQSELKSFPEQGKSVFLGILTVKSYFESFRSRSQLFS